MRKQDSSGHVVYSHPSVEDNLYPLRWNGTSLEQGFSRETALLRLYRKKASDWSSDELLEECRSFLDLYPDGADLLLPLEGR